MMHGGSPINQSKALSVSTFARRPNHVCSAYLPGSYEEGRPKKACTPHIHIARLPSSPHSALSHPPHRPSLPSTHQQCRPTAPAAPAPRPRTATHRRRSSITAIATLITSHRTLKAGATRTDIANANRSRARCSPHSRISRHTASAAGRTVRSPPAPPAWSGEVGLDSGRLAWRWYVSLRYEEEGEARRARLMAMVE